jgi:transaldolase
MHAEVPAEVIQRLRRIPEFVRGYDPDGMQPSDFIGYGATQRTLSQFSEAGWRLLEACK